MSARPSPLMSATATVSLAPASIMRRSNSMSSGREAANVRNAVANSTVRLYIAYLHRVFEPGHRIARRHELLAHIARIADLDQRPHHGRIVDLLRVVKF